MSMQLDSMISRAMENGGVLRTDTISVNFHSDAPQLVSSPFPYLLGILVLVLVITIALVMIYRRRAKNLERQIEIIKLSLEQNKEDFRKEKQRLFKNNISDTAIYQRLRQMALENADKIVTSELLTAEEWQELGKTVDNLDENFTQRLHGDFPTLKPKDIHYCYLFKLGLPATMIATLMGRTPNMIHKRRTMISQSMGIDKAKTTLEKFLLSY